MSGFDVRIVCWSSHAKTLQSIRNQVFIEEQGVPESLEQDPRDKEYMHALATTQIGDPIGTGRLLPDGTIGRMAVLSAWRSRGVGSALLESLLTEARHQGHRTVVLNAQTSAKRFYLRHGFVREGGVFIEAGIPHVRMRLTL